MKAVHLDGFLILASAGIPGFVAMWGSDDAAKYMSPALLFYLRNLTAISGMMLAGLIAFRSKQYANYKANGGAKASDTEFPQAKPVTITPGPGPTTITVEKPASTETIVTKTP